MVTSFKRNGYLFDTVQMVSEVTYLLDYFGVDLPLKRFEGYYSRIFIVDPSTDAAVQIDIPSGIAPFKEMLTTRFPANGKAAVRLVDYTEALFDEFKHLPMGNSLLGNLRALFKCRKIIANANLTFENYMDKFGITDTSLREIFDVFAAFAGLPTERVTALLIAGIMISTLRGCYRPTSGFIKLPHRLRKRAEALGAEIRCKSRVERILTENGKVIGVALEGGEIVKADYVIAAMDTKVAMLEMVGDAVLRRADPAYADKVQQVRMSPSSMIVSLGLDDSIDLMGLGMDCGYNVITTGRGTFEKLFKAFDRGETGYSDTCFHTAAISPSLTIGGKPTVVIRIVPMPIADWTVLRNQDPEAYARRKQAIADFFISKVERYLIPDLTKHIKVVDIASPATFERYIGTPTGSNYDMSPYPDNFGRKRLKMKTPIKGLLLPKFSHSIFGALQAGIHTADHILGGVVSKGCSLV
jgi:phytoene dehydrogenase-like protein